jgi:hypothetical protein
MLKPIFIFTSLAFEKSAIKKIIELPNIKCCGFICNKKTERHQLITPVWAISNKQFQSIWKIERGDRWKKQSGLLLDRQWLCSCKINGANVMGWNNG